MPAHIIWKEDNGKNGYYLADGYRVRSLKTKSKAHALALLKQYNQGRLSLEPCPTVKEYVRPSRVRDHKQIFDRHIIPRFGNTVLTDVKVADLRRWQAELLKGGLKVKTVRNIMDSSFRAMYRDARGEHVSLEGKDPFLDLKWPKAKRLAPDPLSVEEKRRVLNSFAESEPWYYPFMRFQFDTGCRPSETIALTSADITPETRRVSINKSRHLSSDNDHPKTAHSER
jgi:integrase